MKIKSVSEVLQTVELAFPAINALKPNIDNYKVQLLQPKGDIEAGAFGVRNRNRALAVAQYEAFLRSAAAQQADLVITPEYSMPWDVLVDVLTSGLQPRPGDLWVLGCESITLSDLIVRQQQLGGVAKVIFEPMVEQKGRFLDPLVYVFHAPKLSKPTESEVVALIQFKTHPMADPNHFEVSGMQRGTTVYQFDRRDDAIRLVTFICSDALDLPNEVTAAIYKSALVIHIQLNKDPRNPVFRRYRDTLLGYPGDETELICLNWAANISVTINNTSETWRNIAGSAWYLRPEHFDLQDTTLSRNHRRGLYYTWLKPSRFHALFFNFDPAVFVIEATKVTHYQVHAVSSRRLGPKLSEVLTWNESARAWADQGAPRDGFGSVVHEAGTASADIEAVAAQSPLAAECLLALTAGMAGVGEGWHVPRKLDSCAIESDEIIKRITFCQDSNAAAASFRLRRLRRCRELDHILRRPGLPVQIADLQAGYSLVWSSSHAQQNAKSNLDRLATVIYVGDDANLQNVEAVFNNAKNNLHDASKTPDESIEATSRLVVWYREDGQTKVFEFASLKQINKTDRESPVDIGRTG